MHWNRWSLSASGQLVMAFVERHRVGTGLATLPASATAPTTLTGGLARMAREHALLDVKDAADAIVVTPWCVHQLIARGELRAINVGGPEKSARWRVDAEELNVWLVNRENRPRDLIAS